MAYTIYNTDGTVLLTLGDGKIDQKNTSLTLIGKNVASYGEYFNNNLIKLLENFASIDEPVSPMVGQLWYDTATGRLKIYDKNNAFRSVGNLLLNTDRPAELAEGDFWYNTTKQQLFVSVSGTGDPILIGPTDPAEYGKTGWRTETLYDGSHDHTVLSLYNNNQLLAILSGDSTFTIHASTSSFTTVRPGLNLSPTQNLKFIGTATSAETINGLDASKFLRNDIDQRTTGTLTVVNDLGFRIYNSLNENLLFYADPLNHEGTIAYNATNKNLNIEITNSTVGLTSTIYVNALSRNLGIWNTTPQYPLDILGNTRIRGNLIVQGTVTNITSVNLQVNDTNLELGYGLNLDADAVGGGITLHGTTDHTITWNDNGTGWNFNDNVNLIVGNTYQINSSTVITETSLGESITSAPGLVSMGVLDHLTVTNVYITGNTISANGTDQTLYLTGTGSGTVDMSGNVVSSVATPLNDYDASTKKYVDDSLYLTGTKNFAFSLDVTDFPTLFGTVDAGVKNYLDLMFPIVNAPVDALYDIPDGVRAKVLCGTTTGTISTSTVNINYATTFVDKNGVLNSELVVSGLTGAIASSAGRTIRTSVTYEVQTWKTQIGVWTKQS